MDLKTAIRIEYSTLPTSGTATGIALRDANGDVHLLTCWHVLNGRDLNGTARSTGVPSSLSLAFETRRLGMSREPNRTAVGINHTLDLSGTRRDSPAAVPGARGEFFNFDPLHTIDAVALQLPPELTPHNRFIIDVGDILDDASADSGFRVSVS